ncbi:MAG: hypothetical protein SFV55_25820 [Haliscomenobacter sp.]|uniref:hypothetical protein n=1 Tax=Haliscomenobacter sp. TaxID=2717303 RepID=UPI0029B0BD97|nr:hypothetical protein [Haliscomenobacter sp.]MDX2071878.1 hypothetical protein [Haliscomenobacter sp.]
MKNLIVLIVLLTFTLSLNAQQVGINLRLDAAKSFKLDKKTKIEVSQQLQLTPEIKNINRKYDRIFDEFELFPFLRETKDDDDDKDDGDKDDNDDDNDDDDTIKGSTPDGPNKGSNSGSSSGFNDLNDDPYRIDLSWRSSSTFDFDYKIHKWLRVGQSYSLLLDNEDIRHLSRTDLTLQPKMPSKKLDLQYRIAYQLGAESRKGKLRLDSDFSSRLGTDWEFKNRHIWFNNFSVNGAFDEGVWEWDRFRYDTGLEYKFSKTHSFSFGYRFQQRLNRKKNAISHGVSFAYSLDF